MHGFKLHFIKLSTIVLFLSDQTGDGSAKGRGRFAEKTHQFKDKGVSRMQ